MSLPVAEPPIRRPSRDAVRQRVLDAALVEFTNRGYERASLDQVAAAAGFSKGAIYSNFASKEDLFLNLMDRQVRRRVDHLRHTVADVTRPDDRTAATTDVGRVLTSIITDDDDWQVLFLEYVTHAARHPDARAELTARRRNVRDVVATAARDLLGPDHPIWQRVTPDDVAVTVLALTNGLAIERLADPASVPADLLAQILNALL